MSETILENVYYKYPKAKDYTLREINAVFPEGAISSITGHSGAGKSTLLYLISGLDVPTSGRILLDGKELIKSELDQYRRNTVATISQSYLLFPTYTALENAMYPLRLVGRNKKQAAEIASDLLDSVGINKELFNRLPSKLSGGEQQRVAIARCLAANSKIIVADEPTGNLDEKNAKDVTNLLLKLAHEHGRTVILGTHDSMLSERADKHFKMAAGRLSMIGDNE